MPATQNLLAFDLGAESGRGVLGSFDGSRLRLDVIHRFANGPVRLLDRLHWDVLFLFQEMLTALRKAGAAHGPLSSMGVDSWGVDFGLLGRDGQLLCNPRHYRDPHTEGIMEEAFARVSRADIYRRTGLQFMRFNTLFQLLAMKREHSPILEQAESLLLISDLFHYFFTGVKSVETTNASTTQMLDPATRNWAVDLVEQLGLPTKILGTLAPPGTLLGKLRSTVAAEAGITPMPVIAPATHDTGSAVVAAPAADDSWAYISSGTWSLMGVELTAPMVTEQSLAFNFTNEGGVDGTTRFLKNIMGLWLVQECRRSWERAGDRYDYEHLAKLANEAKPLRSLIDPDDARFILPSDMPTAMAEFCRLSHQPVPADPGAFVRCALESLALKYRWVVDRIEEMLGRSIKVIHVVGGGSQNQLLCQLTADACNRHVLAGPVEATAIGNLLTQARGLGLVGSLTEVREIVRRSFEVKTYEPRQPENWDEPYARFRQLLASRP